MPGTEHDYILKVCGITSIEDAREAIEAGANALGFNFYPRSSRYVTPEQAHSIATSVRGAYLRVGVFVNAPHDDVLLALDTVPLDVLQLHGSNDSIPSSSAASSSALRIWRSVAGEAATVEKDDRIEAYLLDTPTPDFGGSGRSFRWELASNFPYRAIVAGGLDGGNVAAAIAALQPWGVDACSRLESQPGKKDRQRVRDFVQAARQAFEGRHVAPVEERRMVSL